METGKEKYWYPLYTKSRHEKKAYENLRKAGYEAFLPLRKTVRKWSDRKKVVDMPLISSYVFSRFKPGEMHDVLNIYGISRYISFAGRPAKIRDEEIEIMKQALSAGADIEAKEGSLKKGAEVTIKSGLFAGYTGKVSSFSGKKKLVIELEGMNKTLLISLDGSQQVEK